MVRTGPWGALLCNEWALGSTSLLRLGLGEHFICWDGALASTLLVMTGPRGALYWRGSGQEEQIVGEIWYLGALYSYGRGLVEHIIAEDGVLWSTLLLRTVPW